MAENATTRLESEPFPDLDLEAFHIFFNYYRHFMRTFTDDVAWEIWPEEDQYYIPMYKRGFADRNDHYLYDDFEMECCRDEMKFYFYLNRNDRRRLFEYLRNRMISDGIVYSSDTQRS